MRLIPTVNSRTPCKTSWWNTNSNRFYLKDANQVTDLTYPVGYSTEDNDAFEFEVLISLDQ